MQTQAPGAQFEFAGPTVETKVLEESEIHFRVGHIATAIPLTVNRLCNERKS